MQNERKRRQDYLKGLATIKESFKKDYDGRKAVAEYTERMMSVLDFLDDEMKGDVVSLCLCGAAVDGKISIKEKRYVKRLCKA